MVFVIVVLLGNVLVCCSVGGSDCGVAVVGVGCVGDCSRVSGCGDLDHCGVGGIGGGGGVCDSGIVDLRVGLLWCWW